MALLGYRIPPKQVVGGLLFWAAIAAVLWSTRSLPIWFEGAPGPRFMPIVLAALLALLAVGYWVEAATRIAEDEPDEERGFARPTAFVAIIVALALAWEPLGAVLTVLACALIELKFLEGFSWPRSIAAAACISAAVLVLFQFALGVQLPGGVLDMLPFVSM